jgi:hypothetical protein
MNVEMGRIILLRIKKKYPEGGRNAASSVPQVSVNGVSINVSFVHMLLVLCNNFMPCS